MCGGVKLLNCFVNDDSKLHPSLRKNVDIFLIQYLGLGVLWCLTPLSTIFQLYRGEQFYRWMKLEYPENHQQTLSHKVVSSTPYHGQCFSVDRH